MYTLITIGIVLYAWSIYKIYKCNGSKWSNFSPIDSTFLSCLYFFYISGIAVIFILLAFASLSIAYLP